MAISTTTTNSPRRPMDAERVCLFSYALSETVLYATNRDHEWRLRDISQMKIHLALVDSFCQRRVER